MAGHYTNRVLWSEGLFLRVQHFQQSDRFAESLMRGALRAGSQQAWGFTTLRLDPAALAAGRVAVEAAEGVMPDGMPFSIPEDTDRPEPVEIPREQGAGVVHLAFPLEQFGAIAFEREHEAVSGARHRGQIVTLQDASDREAEREEVEVARPSARLLPPGAALDGFAAMAVGRVEGVASDGTVQMAAEFLPPTLRIGAAGLYLGWLREIVTGLDRVIEAHGDAVAGGTGRSVENLLILQLANRARPRLQHVLTQAEEHPSVLFAELAGLAGEMTTYGAASRRMDALPDYAHSDPAAAFGPLVDTLRSLLLTLGHIEARAWPLPVMQHDRTIWKVRVENPELLETCRVVLRVRGDASEDVLRQLFTERATVGAAEAFDGLWRARLTGIGLRPLHSQPREIPYEPDCVCFELDRRGEEWARLLSSVGFVIGVSGAVDGDPRLDCFAVRR
ncbi:MAG: type VI secretion system baseplate subunit TssK [Pseudomonadota bacterium]